MSSFLFIWNKEKRKPKPQCPLSGEQLDSTHNLKYHPLLLTGTSSIQYGADGIDGAPLFADDFSNVFLGNRQFNDCGIAASPFGYQDLIGIVNQGLDNVFHQGLNRSLF